MGRSAQLTPRERLAERIASVPLARLEALAALLLLVAAIVPRVRDLDTRFDRGADGARGAELAIAAVNFERGEARGAFPILDTYATVIDRHEPVLAHRSPLVPWTAWAGARLFAPAGWAEAVARSEAPEGFEFGMRIPFFAAHVLALLLVWAVAREAYGRQVGLLALAFAAASPVGIHFAGLVGTESLALPAALLLVLFGLRWARRGARGDLAGAGAAAALGAALSHAPLLFLPGLWVLAWRRRGWRAAAVVSAVTVALGGAVFLVRRGAGIEAARRTAMAELADPFLVLHASFTVSKQGEFGPLAGAARIWSGTLGAFGIVIVSAALLAGLLRAARALSPAASQRLSALERPRPSERDLPALGVLAAGALFAQLVLAARLAYEDRRELQLWWWPVLALGAALLVRQFSGPLLSLRAGVAPLVLAVLALALPGLGVHAAWRARTRGDASSVPMPHEVGAWLATHTEPNDFITYDHRLGSHAQLALYAWRTTRPGPSDFAGAHFVPSRPGIEYADEYWLAPARGNPAYELAPLPAVFEEARARVEDDLWHLYEWGPNRIRAKLEPPPVELAPEDR